MRHIKTFLALCFLCVIGSLFGASSSERKAILNAMTEKDFLSLPPDALTWLSKQDIPVAQYNKTVAKIHWDKVFSQITTISKQIKKTASYGLLPEHIQKNIHLGCVPYDETRTLRDIKGFYISASDVLTPEQGYIVGEMPIASTEDAFWRAIVETDARTIVALVTPTDAAYWDDSRFPKKVHRWTIEKISEKEIAKSPFFPSHRIVQRLFKLSDSDRNEGRIVTHLHYENWPDHDAPEATLFHWLLALVDTVHPESCYPIFVHCAAGIGRSGTFVAAHSLRKDIQQLKDRNSLHYVSIARRILEIRMQRKHLLGNPIQLRAVVEAVRDAIQQSGIGLN